MARMSENTPDTPAGHGYPPAAGPTATATAEPPGAPEPTAPAAPTTEPSAPRGRFGQRLRHGTLTLWLALVVAAACLIVGLGVGALLGHATAGHGDRFDRDGFPQGPGLGQRPDGRSGGQQGGFPDGRPDGPLGEQGDSSSGTTS